MDIRLTTSEASINNLFQQAVVILSQRIKYNLSYLGEVCVKKVRDRSEEESWCDQTGNLRSSVQYAIYQYGKKAVASAFKQILDGRDGVSKASKMAEEIAPLYRNTFNTLVVMAAMEYAENVEALENKDVLASIEIYARRNVDKYINKALKEAETEIQKLEITL